MARPPTARAIIYAAAFGGLSLDQANELLRSAGLDIHQVPPATWKMILRNEVALFKSHPERMGEFIFSPKPVGDWS